MKNMMLHVETLLQLYKTQSHILPSLIKACSVSQAHHTLGLQLHCHSLKLGLHLNPVVSNSFISFYAKFHDIISARKVFDEMSQRDSVSWNSMINCFCQNRHCVEALEMFKKMYESGFVAKPELVASVISVSVRYGFTRVGRMIHALSVVDQRFGKSVFLSTALVDMYWRCGESVNAFRVFDAMEDKNEVSWTSMIMGYVGIRDYSMALDYFRQMQVEGFQPNRVTLITVLPACVELGTISLGKDIHGFALRHGLNSDIRLLTSLIHLYSKQAEFLPLAERIFEMSIQKDVTLWSSIITGYSQHKQSAKNSILLLSQMQREGVQPNSVTLLAVLTACTNIPSVTLGSLIHGNVSKSGLDSDVSITNSLINMYSKCGSLKDSRQIFKEMSSPDCVSWSALINAYGIHGCGEEALQVFREMKEERIHYDSITFLSVLSACNHSGLVKDARKLFSEVAKDDKLLLNSEHYACYIDLLGRAGKFELASEVLRTMPMNPSPKIMSSLVSACKLHGRLDVAETLLSWFIESEPDNAANHTLLSIIFAQFGKWLNVETIQRDMKSMGLKKTYGFSRLESLSVD